MQKIFSALIPQSFSHPAFLPWFSAFLLCASTYILPQAIALVLWSFSFSKECSPLSHSHFLMLREFWVRQNKDRPTALDLQGKTCQNRQHNSLETRSLCSLREQVPILEKTNYHLHTCHQSRGSTKLKHNSSPRLFQWPFSSHLCF